MAFPISVHILDSLNFFDALNNLFSLFFPTLEIELFTALNCFAGAVKTQNLMGAPFLFELVAVVS